MESLSMEDLIAAHPVYNLMEAIESHLRSRALEKETPSFRSRLSHKVGTTTIAVWFKKEGDELSFCADMGLSTSTHSYGLDVAVRGNVEKALLLFDGKRIDLAALSLPILDRIVTYMRIVAGGTEHPLQENEARVLLEHWYMKNRLRKELDDA